MASKKYNLNFEFSDGTTKSVPFAVPQGKSAYDTAKDGGYTGTEEQFAAKLAASIDVSALDPILGSIDHHDERITHTEKRITVTEKRITNLEKGVAADAFETDNSVAYVKSVPANAAPYAAISKVGGMTKKCTNLFDKSKVGTSAKETSTGFSFTGKGAASVTIGQLGTVCPSVKVGDTITYYADRTNHNESKKFLYLAATATEWTSGRFITVTEAMLDSSIYAYGVADATCTFDNMRVVNQQGVAYEPYFADLRHAAVTEFVSKGANLLRFKERTVTANGITFAGNSDGTITVNGTATAHAYFDFAEIISLDETDTGYLLDGCPEGGSDVKYAIQLYHTKADGSTGQLIMGEFGRGQPFTTAYKNFKAMIVVRSGTTVSNLVFKPRIIEQSKKDLPFRKAFCRTFPIPEAVQALEGYGQGNPENPDEYNAIVWREDGTRVYEHKGNNEDGAWVALDVVEITDISDILPADNLIEVEGGGTITFENEHGLAVPSEVIYQTKGAAV